MDSKRKVTVAGSPGGDDRTPKRRKVPTAIHETPETTRDAGLSFLALLKQARDKYGRIYSTNYLTLPDKERHSRYYEMTAIPLALDTIEANLNALRYPNLTTLESDLKRMVADSKRYYEKATEKYSDAERIRKMVSSWMPKNNPAYQDPKYQPFPTPLPGEGKITKRQPDPEVDQDADAEAVTDDEAIPQGNYLSSQHDGGKPRELSAKPASFESKSTQAARNVDGEGNDFQGYSFQRAQEKILSEMFDLQDDNGQSISAPFRTLPSQQLRDYYTLIKNPVSLNSLHKKIRGFMGREKPVVSKSVFQSWAAFEEETSLIWRNARVYNEDGSLIFELAGDLETFFYQRLEKAKEVVREPAQPDQRAPPSRIKLKLPPPSQQRITLRVNNDQNGTPTPATATSMASKANNVASPGVGIDGGALERQQKHVQAGVNGTDSSIRPGPKNPFGGSGSSPATGTIPTLSSLSLERTSSASGASPTPSASGVKTENQPGQSPALRAVNPSRPGGEIRRDSHGSNQAMKSPYLAASTMPPPSGVTPRLRSGSPHPISGQHHAHIPHTPAPAAVAPSDNRWRQPGKDASDALLSNVSVSTNPELNIKQHFHLDIAPSATLSQQSVTFNLPSTYNSLRIIPTMAAHLNNRPSKIFVTYGTRRLQPISQSAHQNDSRRPVYEVTLELGVTRIEIEAIAAPLKGAPKAGNSQDIEFEKVTLFPNLLKA